MEDQTNQGRSDRQMEESYKLLAISIAGISGLLIGLFIFNLLG
jgi:hypothetical protein